LDHQKGIECLQQQIDRIAPQESNRKLLLVGDGPLRCGLEAWCDQVGPQRVRLLPWQADVAPILRACQLLVLPSRYEGMPNAVLEAMAASKPVVCSLVEGSEELLADAAQYQGFPSGDASQMASLIERLLSDEAIRLEIGLGNQARVKQLFSLSSMTEAYRAHYRALLTRRLDVP
jgi:glycosyltransferase involved in cell wall biosynthesis